MTEENELETTLEEITSQETETTDETVEETLLEGQQEGESLKDFALRVAKEKADIEEKNKQLFARTQKTKGKIEKKGEKSSDDNSIDEVDLAEFFATGYKREDLEDVQAVMRGKTLSFAEALKDPMFTTVQEKKALERKEQEAQLGASKSGGSGNKTLKEQASTPGLSDEEHKKLWAESVKNLR